MNCNRCLWCCACSSFLRFSHPWDIDLHKQYNRRLQPFPAFSQYLLMRFIWSNFICTFRRLHRRVLDCMFLPLELINILRTKHLELKTLTMPQITTYTVPRTNIKIEYTDRHANLSQGGHNKKYNHTWRKYLWETPLETTERSRNKRLVPMVKKECAIPAEGNMHDTMCQRNGEQDKGERAIEIHWMMTFEWEIYLDLYQKK